MRCSSKRRQYFFSCHLNEGRERLMGQPEGEMQCVFCWDAIPQGEEVNLPCGHREFHFQCITQMSQRTCPLCRQPFDVRCLLRRRGSFQMSDWWIGTIEFTWNFSRTFLLVTDSCVSRHLLPFLLFPDLEKFWFYYFLSPLNPVPLPLDLQRLSPNFDWGMISSAVYYFHVVLFRLLGRSWTQIGHFMALENSLRFFRFSIPRIDQYLAEKCLSYRLLTRQEQPSWLKLSASCLGGLLGFFLPLYFHRRFLFAEDN